MTNFAATNVGFRRNSPRSFLAMATRGKFDFLVFACVWVIVFTTFAALSKNNLTNSLNMVENWAWGQEFQLGYFKHPPLFAWVAGAWFQVFPRVDWAYFLLSDIVVAIGFLGIWMALGTIEDGRRRDAAIMVLVFSPLYGFLSLKFNANTILIAVWPWAIWAFLKVLSRPSARNGAVLGALLALGMLGKYFTAVLIVSMIVAVLVEPERRRLLRSPAALTTPLTALALFSPHLAWMVHTDFQTVFYAGHVRNDGVATILRSIVSFPIAHLLYQLPILLAVLVALPRAKWGSLTRIFSGATTDPRRRRHLILAFGPFVVTMILAIGAFSGLPPLWGEPLWLLSGWVLLSAPGIEPDDILLPRLRGVMMVFAAGLVAAAPIVDVISVTNGSEEAILPAAEIARTAETVWHEVAGGARFSIVTGDEMLAGSTAFYADEAPSELLDYDFGHSPWIDAARFDAQGALAVCRANDQTCIGKAHAVLGPDLDELEMDVSKSWRGRDLAATRVLFLIRRPAADRG